MRIALAGNPNSGKTTMYNALTGRNEKVGNWAGVTVEKKENPIKKVYYSGEEALIAVDLPGAYSISPFTSEENVTSEYIQNENPDAIINIVDATNLSRSLFFTTQLMELDVPMVVALNKTDINEKKKTDIDVSLLSQLLGCPVVETISTSAEGLKELIDMAVAQRGVGQNAPYVPGEVDHNDPQAIRAADRSRFDFVKSIVAQVESRKVFTNERNKQDTFDHVITHPLLGLLVFAAVMFLVFQISQAWVGPWIAEGYEFANGTVIPGLVTLIDAFKDWVAGMLTGAHPFLAALLTEGVIGGLSAVVSFLPLVMVMYFLIALLEDCGYMARATVVLDPLFKKVGLSGKSVIPFVVGTGCSIPGVMACRTIRNDRERNTAAMLTPFMPCGAKLPVIALFAGAFFDGAGWVGTLMYFVGIAVILLGAVMVNCITGNRHRKSYFIIELPEYKSPSLKRASLSMLSRGWSFIVKAGTVILLCNTLVYVMQSFSWSLNVVAESDTILASVARPISFLLIPIGINSWKMAAASITGFIAKENVVGTLSVCYGLSAMPSAEDFGFTAVVALAYLMFNLFTPPCFAAIGAMHAEISERKWFWGGIALQMGTGYTLAYLVYQMGTLLTTGHMGAGFIPGLAVVMALVAVVVFLCIRGNQQYKKEKSGKWMAAAEK